MQDDPNHIPDGALMLVAFGITLVVWRLVRGVQEAPIRPDPWDSDVEDSLQASEAVPVCHHCFTPQFEHSRFCQECGSSIGAYNNLLPYVNLFSIGEAFRTGTSGKYRITPVTVIGFLFWSSTEYHIFAPVYWYFWYRNFKLISKAHPEENELINEK
jgi:hypothetical protein